MNTQIQLAAQKFYETRCDSDFNILTKLIYDKIIRISRPIVRDEETACENANNVLMKIYYSQTFVFDPDKSYLAYIYKVAHNGAKMLFNRKKRDKLISESKLSGNPCEDKDNILDFLNEEPTEMNFELQNDCLHSDTESLYDRILNSFRENIDDEDNRSIIMDALCSDVFRELEEEAKTDKNKKKELEYYKRKMKKYGFNISTDVQNYADIAKKYNLQSVGAVKTKVFRAKEKIKIEVTKEMAASKATDGDNIDGIHRYYYKDGKKKKAEITYKNGLMHGKHIEWWKNGKIKMECNYVDNKLDGKYVTYYKNGFVMQSGHYKDGIRCGDWIGYNPDQSVNSEYNYCSDATFFCHYDKNGKVVDSGIL